MSVPQGVQASVLPIVQTTKIDGVGAGGNGQMAVTPPPPDMTADAGVGVNVLPGANTATAGLLALARQKALAGTMAQSQGLLAQGAPQQQAQQQQVPMLQQHRGRATRLFPLLWARSRLRAY